MKKISLVALISFAVGLLLTAFIFVYSPDTSVPDNFVKEDSKSDLSTNLYAKPTQELRSDLNFAAVAEKVGPAVVSVLAEKV